MCVSCTCLRIDDPADLMVLPASATDWRPPAFRRVTYLRGQARTGEWGMRQATRKQKRRVTRQKHSWACCCLKDLPPPAFRT
jgi:hypothetical protein